MTRRCPTPDQPLAPHDHTEITRFAGSLADPDPDPDRHAAYARHYPTTSQTAGGTT